MKSMFICLIAFAAVSGLQAQERCFTVAYGEGFKAAAEQTAAARTELLAAFQDGSRPVQIKATADLSVVEKLGHLILIGLPSDPLIRDAWQREARFEDDGEFFVFGFGRFKGAVGFIESGRNPFLYGHLCPKERKHHSECVVLSGSTSAGIGMAVTAFLEQGVVNGAVAEKPVRGREGLLDRDPFSPSGRLPEVVVPEGYAKIGVSICGEEEYRNVLEICGVEPEQMVRYKFLKKGWWNTSAREAEDSFNHYRNGLHRKAVGNTVTVLRFADSKTALTVSGRISAAVGTKNGKGKQPSIQPGWDNASAGPLVVTQNENLVYLSTCEE